MANSKFDIKIKETLYKTLQLAQLKKLKCTTKSFSSHNFIIASVPLVLLCLCFVLFLFLLFFFFFFGFFFFLFFFLFFFFFFCVFLLSIISLSLSVINGFYCLNYTSLLLHLITTHLVSHVSLSSIVFIIFTQIIGIFLLITRRYYFI